MSDQTSTTRRLLATWLVLGAISVLAVVFLLGPHMPPGRASAEASDQTTTNIVLTAILAPIAVGLLVYFAVLASGRSGSAARPIEDGPPLRGNARIQATWVISTTLIVLLLRVLRQLLAAVDRTRCGWRPGLRSACEAAG